MSELQERAAGPVLKRLPVSFIQKHPERHTVVMEGAAPSNEEERIRSRPCDAMH